MTTEAAKENGQPEVVGFRVFVGNLSYDVDTDKLKEFFGQAGEMYNVRSVKVWDDDNNLVCVSETASMNSP
jgi:RNA recognition motif-containing protein